MTTTTSAPALQWSTNATADVADAELGGHSVFVTRREDGAYQLGGDLGYHVLTATDMTDAQREAETVLRRGLLRMLAMLR